MERRFNSLELREEKGIVSGYALLWDEPSKIENFSERFLRDSISEHESGVSFYFQHNKEGLLGNTLSKTLRVTSDERGLKYSIKLPDTSLGRDVRELIKRGDLQGVSVGFISEKENFTGNERTISKATLFEISLVDKPAHKTTISLRNKKPKRRKHWTSLLIEV